MWVLVIYEMEKFIGRVAAKKCQQVMVHCLEKPFGIGVAQKFERENEAIYYRTVYSTTVVPTEVGSSTTRKLFWSYTL